MTPIKYRSGLGLSISRELVRRMGGEIWLQSEEGKGTEIIFQLPVTLGTKASSTRPSPARADSLTWGVSAARQHENQSKHAAPIKTIAIFTRNNQVWDFLSEMCASIGLTVVNNHYSDPIRTDNINHSSCRREDGLEEGFGPSEYIL